MMNTRFNLMMVLVCLLSSPALAADPHDKTLATARRAHTRLITKASAVYQRNVNRANSNLKRAYERAIAHYERIGKNQRAADLSLKLEQILTESALPAAPKKAQADENPQGHLSLIKAIGKIAVNAEKKQISSNVLSNKKYVLVYFSANWCGPCRKFTPELVAFHKKYKNDRNFEVVFVSADRSEADMHAYMKKVGMPWIAIPYAKIQTSGLKQKYGGSGIPRLVLVDEQDKIISVGQRKVLADLESKL